jgi:hypothetical protein
LVNDLGVVNVRVAVSIADDVGPSGHRRVDGQAGRPARRRRRLRRSRSPSPVAGRMPALRAARRAVPLER